MEPSSVTTNFQDMEPGWSSIYFSHPPRLAKSRLHSLLQSLETWRQTHPMRRIERIQVIEDGAIVRGLNVIWSIFEHLQEQSMIAHFNIDEEVRDLYGHEYAEALMHDAVGFAAENQSPDKTVALVSRRRVVIVIVRPGGQAFVTTWQKFLNSIENSQVQEISGQFEDWRIANEQGFFCVVLPGEYTP